MQLVSFSIILLKRACKKAKIIYGRNKKDGFTFHNLRHTFKTDVCKADVPELVIIEIAGHSTKKMFDCQVLLWCRRGDLLICLVKTIGYNDFKGLA